MTDAAGYRQQLITLLPPSDQLDTDEGSNIWLLLDALAQEFSRVDARGEQLLEEMDPRSTYELLIDWERMCGLPASCVPAAQTLEERRDAIYTKITERGGQSRQYFIDLAAALGYTITITEFEAHHVGMGVDAPIYGTDWRFAFQVNAPAETVRVGTVQSGVDEPIRSWGNALLECAINEDKPAHTAVLYAYG